MPPRYNVLWTTDHLRRAADAFLADLRSAHSVVVLNHFSTTELITFDHSPRDSYHSILYGVNAVRSYLDLIATHWTCHDLIRHHMEVSLESKQVVVTASATWKWKKSKKSWKEDFTCTLTYDESMKIRTFVIRTDSAPETCVMRAVERP
ncbi:hypothetical protein ONZ45_g14931 [Pleurotus djamor]|nr:hypothetical protein ONZ45_g14931 [Pleurotus djamor]